MLQREMDQLRNKGKKVEIPQYISSDVKDARVMSFTESIARNTEAREQQQYIKEYGPDLFTGDGMESQQFLKDLGKRNERSGWTKAMETKAEGLAKFMGGTSRETIVKEFTQQALGRAEQIRKFANEHSEQMYNTTGHKIKSINEYLHFRLGIIHISADRCLLNPDKRYAKETAPQILAVESDLLQNFEWRLKNAKNLEHGVNINKKPLESAYRALEAYSALEYASLPLNQRALRIVCDKVREETIRVKHIHKVDFGSRDQYGQYREREKIYNPIARKINKDMGTFLDSMDSDDPGKMLVQERDEFKKRVSGYIQNCKSVFLFGEYINTLLSPKPSEQPSSAPGPSDIAFWKKSSPPSQEEFDIT